jgi:heme exporter protein A
MSLFAGHDITCVRGGRTVFAGLDFALGPGEALVLLGPNGSGKSSLLRLMAGLLRPAKGAVTWDGEPIADDPEAHHGRFHYVGHQDALKAALTVAENLRFWASLAGATGDEDAIRAALARFGLAHLSDIPFRMLSAGQRRRLALARTLAAAAPLWLLDEPTVALDSEAVAALEETLAGHRDGGGMAVIATHAAIDVGAARELDLSRHAVAWFAPTEMEGPA